MNDEEFLKNELGVATVIKDKKEIEGVIFDAKLKKLFVLILCE